MLASKETNPLVEAAVYRIEELMKSYLKVDIQYNDELMMEVQTVPTTEKKDECFAKDNVCIRKGAWKDEIPSKVVKETDAASIRVFCRAPEEGGFLTFPKAGVHVNPREVKGEALVMVFADPANGEKDEDPFIEEFVECPVLHGELVTVVDYYHIPRN
jgi:hypothetical protein